MPIVTYQRHPEQLSIEQDSPSSDQEWVVDGTESTTLMYAAITAALPANYMGLWLQQIKPNHVGAGRWDIKVHYGKMRPLAVGVATFQAETSGKTIHREQSLETINSYAPPDKEAPDFKQLIGVDMTQGTVAGVDVEVPGFQFTINRKYRSSEVPANFVATIYAATGKVNNSPFHLIWKGQILFFDEQEVKLLGASITDAGQDPSSGGQELFEVNYKFEYSANATGLTIGDIEDIKKKGWEYLWVLRTLSTDASGAPIMKPKAVYIEKVFETTDFSQLLLTP